MCDSAHLRYSGLESDRDLQYIIPENDTYVPSVKNLKTNNVTRYITSIDINYNTVFTNYDRNIERMSN